jgi:hypothetical protein
MTNRAVELNELDQIIAGAEKALAFALRYRVAASIHERFPGAEFLHFSWWDLTRRQRVTKVLGYSGAVLWDCTLQPAHASTLAYADEVEPERMNQVDADVTTLHGLHKTCGVTGITPLDPQWSSSPTWRLELPGR